MDADNLVETVRESYRSTVKDNSTFASMYRDIQREHGITKYHARKMLLGTEIFTDRLDDSQKDSVVEMYKGREVSVKGIAKNFGMSTNHIYDVLYEMRNSGKVKFDWRGRPKSLEGKTEQYAPRAEGDTQSLAEQKDIPRNPILDIDNSPYKWEGGQSLGEMVGVSHDYNGVGKATIPNHTQDKESASPTVVPMTQDNNPSHARVTVEQDDDSSANVLQIPEQENVSGRRIHRGAYVAAATILLTGIVTAWGCAQRYFSGGSEKEKTPAPYVEDGSLAAHDALGGVVFSPKMEEYRQATAALRHGTVPDKDLETVVVSEHESNIVRAEPVITFELKTDKPDYDKEKAFEEAMTAGEAAAPMQKVEQATLVDNYKEAREGAPDNYVRDAEEAELVEDSTTATGIGTNVENNRVEAETVEPNVNTHQQTRIDTSNRVESTTPIGDLAEKIGQIEIEGKQYDLYEVNQGDGFVGQRYAWDAEQGYRVPNNLAKADISPTSLDNHLYDDSEKAVEVKPDLIAAPKMDIGNQSDADGGDNIYKKFQEFMNRPENKGMTSQEILERRIKRGEILPDNPVHDNVKSRMPNIPDGLLSQLETSILAGDIDGARVAARNAGFDDNNYIELRQRYIDNNFERKMDWQELTEDLKQALVSKNRNAELALALGDYMREVRRSVDQLLDRELTTDEAVDVHEYNSIARVLALMNTLEMMGGAERT